MHSAQTSLCRNLLPDGAAFVLLLVVLGAAALRERMGRQF